MNPNLNNHLRIPHDHQASHSSSQLQPNPPSLHSLHHPQLLTPSHPSPAHLQPRIHLPPSSATEDHTLLDSSDYHQAQQQAHIEKYKNAAVPAYHGYIETTHDALIIFNACHLGLAPKVTRRLHERERRSIFSGAVYVFDESEAGIKRWTDGRMWSPSRILNNFLVYREIDQKRPTNSAASAVNASCPSANPSKKHGDPSTTSHAAINNNLTLEDHPSTPSSDSHLPSEPPARATSSHQQQQHQSAPKPESSLTHDISLLDSKPNISKDGPAPTQLQPRSSPENQSLSGPDRRPMNRERERALVGSLTSTYKFRPEGLVKKTISLAGMHMISYYRMEDVLFGRLRTPKSDPNINYFRMSDRFLQPAFFRVPPSWGVTSDGVFWFQDEADESTQVPSSSNSPSFHNAQRTGPSALPKPQSVSGNTVQGVRGPGSQSHPNPSDRILPPALSRPGSSASSAGSTGVTSPVSTGTFPLLAAPNLNPQAGESQSSVVNSVGGRPHFSRLPNISDNSSSSSPIPLNRQSGSSPSARYTPYPRPTCSPPLSASSTVSNNTLAEQQATVPYYAQNQSSSSMNGYSTSSFLSDSHSTSLVAVERNTRPDSNAHNGRALDSMGQVAYGDSGSYRTHATTSGGAESIYAQYTTADTINESNRQTSASPSPYGLPSMNRLRASGSNGSSSPNTDGRGMRDFQFSASPNQQQAGRLSSAGLSHGGSYNAYLSPVSTEFRCHSGGPSLSGRENTAYSSSQQPPGSLNNPSGQSHVSATQSPTFLYATAATPTSATSFPSTYQLSANMINQQPQDGNASRRGSTVASLAGEMDHETGDVGGGRIVGLSRTPSRALQRSENDNRGSHWGPIGGSHTMKTEEGGGE